MSETIIVRRRRMRGDVLLCTPIVRAIVQRSPGAVIQFETDYPEILADNPLVSAAGANFHRTTAMLYELEIAFDRLPGWHIIDALALGAGFKQGEVKRVLEMFPAARVGRWAAATLGPVAPRPVVIAPGPGLWTGRNWAESRWKIICRWLLDAGEKVVLIGMGQDYKLPCTLDLRGRTTFHQCAEIVRAGKLFVGIDSFPAHIAGAMKTPRVVLFGVTRPEFILCDGPRTFPVCSEPSHAFTGARHKVSAMRQVNLGNPPQNPMDTIQTERVVAAIQPLLSA